LYLEKGVEFNLFFCIVVVIYAFGLIHSKVIDVFQCEVNFQVLGYVFV